MWSRDLVYAGGRLIGGVRSTAAQPTVKLTASAVSVSEAASSVTVTAKLNTSTNLACPVTVAYDTVPGTATAGWDYAVTSGTLTFAAGTANNATATITVPLIPDTTFEANETFSVVLSSVTGGTIAAAGAAVITITDNDPSPLMAIEQPAPGATVKTPFTVPGWAIDATVATGTGVDIVHVYATPSGGSATFLGAAPYGAPHSDIGALYGTRFTNSGYTFSATLTPGAYVVTVYARNSATGVFNNAQTVSVAVAASSPNGLVEDPTPNQTLAQPFTMKGWVFDAGSSGVGIDRVQVYAYPNPGSGAPAMLVGDATIGMSRPDVAVFAGAEHEHAGFEREIRGLTPGAYQLVAVARSSVDGHEFWVPNPVTVAVQANPHMWVDTPTANSAVNQTFTVAGWAVDVAAASGTGVSTLHVWAYPSSGSPIFLGVPTYGGPRSDIGAIFGAQFTNSGLGSPRAWHRARTRSSSMPGARLKTTSISPTA